jgi:hypothetical protein
MKPSRNPRKLFRLTKKMRRKFEKWTFLHDVPEIQKRIREEEMALRRKTRLTIGKIILAAILIALGLVAVYFFVEWSQIDIPIKQRLTLTLPFERSTDAQSSELTVSGLYKPRLSE